MKNILTKLLEAQKQIGVVLKDADNPFFKSKYADINSIIEVVKPVMNKVGLVILQPLTHDENGALIKTIIGDPESGEIFEDSTRLPHNDDPQKQGAIITYFRRYAIQSMLFVQAEDTDANDTNQARTEPKLYQVMEKKQQPVGDSCQRCGGEIVHNPRTGKNFCKDKCWLRQTAPIDKQEAPPPNDMPF